MISDEYMRELTRNLNMMVFQGHHSMKYLESIPTAKRDFLIEDLAKILEEIKKEREKK